MKKWWIIISLASAFAFQFAHAASAVPCVDHGTYCTITQPAGAPNNPFTFGGNYAGFYPDTSSPVSAYSTTSPTNYWNTTYTYATTSIPSFYFNWGNDISNPLYYLQINGSTGRPTTVDKPTSIDQVLPFDESTTSLGADLQTQAIGWINQHDVIVGNDITTGLSIHFSIQKYIQCIRFGICLSDIRSIRIPVDVIATTSQSFLESTTTAPLNENGLYLMSTSLDEPNSILFGLIPFGYSQIVATSTVFSVGTLTTAEQLILEARLRAAEATSTEAFLNSCLPLPNTFNINDCVQALFVPKQIPDFASAFGSIRNKAPFGYYNAVSSAFSNISTTTASTTLEGATVLTSILAPIRLIFEALLWFLFALWIFHRIRMWDFHV